MTNHIQHIVELLKGIELSQDDAAILYTEIYARTRIPRVLTKQTTKRNDDFTDSEGSTRASFMESGDHR